MNSMYSTDNNNKLQPQNEQEQRMYENVDKFLNSVDEHFPFIQLYNNNYNIENDISNNPSNYYNKQPSSITIKNNNQTSNGTNKEKKETRINNMKQKIEQNKTTNNKIQLAGIPFFPAMDESNNNNNNNNDEQLLKLFIQLKSHVELGELHQDKAKKARFYTDALKILKDIKENKQMTNYHFSTLRKLEAKIYLSLGQNHFGSEISVIKNFNDAIYLASIDISNDILNSTYDDTMSGGGSSSSSSSSLTKNEQMMLNIASIMKRCTSKITTSSSNNNNNNNNNTINTTSNNNLINKNTIITKDQHNDDNLLIVIKGHIGLGSRPSVKRRVEHYKEGLKLLNYIEESKVKYILTTQIFIGLGNTQAYSVKTQIELFTNALILSKKIEYKQLQIKACLGLANTGKEQRYLEDALRLAMEIRDKELEIKARIGLGSFTFSLEHCNAAIHLATELGDSLLQIKAIKIKGIALKQHGKYYESINCLKDISIHRDVNPIPVYIKQKANSLLEECINKLDKNEAVHFVRRFGHSYPSVQAKIYIFLGNVNRRQLQYEYYMNALENAKRIVNDDYLKMLLTARAYIGLGRIATGEIRDEQRVAYLKHAIKLAHEIFHMALKIESHKSNFDKEKDRRQYYMEQQERFHYLICQANIQLGNCHLTRGEGVPYFDEAVQYGDFFTNNKTFQTFVAEAYIGKGNSGRTFDNRLRDKIRRTEDQRSLEEYYRQSNKIRERRAFNYRLAEFIALSIKKDKLVKKAQKGLSNIGFKRNRGSIEDFQRELEYLSKKQRGTGGENDTTIVIDLCEGLGVVHGLQQARGGGGGGGGGRSR